ncbi:unnamed protein product [Adineta steineri]|uniref:Tetratricopeptide repeat protein n=1 Tax=Adineta steineri TaxID=433720 RepID=A0A814QW62_9BILA|nr:unnamed protein product [Adineta steineri]CAF1145807.1 unnamed protein product [Adineta steineri]
MGFFVQDLHRQIEQLYSQTHEKTKQILYRGQGISKIEFEKVKQSQGGLWAFNNFLSTSTDRDVSLAFAESVESDPDLIGILFQMEIDPFVSSTVFGSLNGTAYYSEENEILFSMHTVFRIGEIVQINDQLWQVNLALTNDNDEQLKSLTDYVRAEFANDFKHHQLGMLLRRIDKLDQAEEFFKGILESTVVKSLEEIADLHAQLGGIKHSQEDSLEALAHFQSALNIREKVLKPTDLALAKTYSSIGSTYCLMANYTSALAYHEKALKIREEVLPPIHSDLGIAYTNLGVVHHRIGDYQTALSYSEKALDIKEKTLPLNHPSLAITYHNIGRLHELMKDHFMALAYYEKTLMIEEKSLPPTHSSLGTTYSNIGAVYLTLENYSDALLYFEKALNNYQNSLLPNHPNLAATYNNMGTLYKSMKNYSTALLHHDKALEIQLTSLPSNHPTFAKTFFYIGEVYYSMENYSTALLYYAKAFEIQAKSLPSSHPNFALFFDKIKLVRRTLGFREETITCVE